MKPMFTRRTILQGAAAAAAVSALPIRAMGAESKGIRLGVASYTFRNFSRARVIDYSQQLRVSELNAKDVKDHLPAETAEETSALAAYSAAAIQLHAVGAVAFATEDEALIRGKFEYAKRAGVNVIVAGDPTPENLPTIEQFVKAYDIRIAIHNHGPEDKRWHSPVDVLKAVSSLDPRIGCCIDVGHTARAGVDPVDAIRKADASLFNIHMKDLSDFSSKESQVPVGEGRMPVRQIFEALLAIKYQGFVDLEYEVHPDDPMPGVLSSFAYMRNQSTSLMAK